MPVEIIYTSVERGLTAGTRGLCIVASSRGAPKGLIEQLRSLSVYKHVFSPDHPKALLNPVVYSHSTLRVGADTYHVLSRICDAGLDYSGRTNLLAHHVALEHHELGRHNPAALMLTPGFLRDKWSGDPAWLPPKLLPPPDQEPSKKCPSWSRLTGDGAWAGMLAEKILNRDRSDVYLIVEPGIPTLPLMLEAARLLPDNQRWAATFCTYYTHSLQGVDCKWRCILSGSEEAAAARRIPGSLVLDLTKPLGKAPDNALAEAARSGQGTTAVSTPPPMGPLLSGSAARRKTPDLEAGKPANISATARTPPPRPLQRSMKTAAVPWRTIGVAAVALMVVVAGASAATWYSRVRTAKLDAQWLGFSRSVDKLAKEIDGHVIAIEDMAAKKGPIGTFMDEAIIVQGLVKSDQAAFVDSISDFIERQQHLLHSHTKSGSEEEIPPQNSNGSPDSPGGRLDNDELAKLVKKVETKLSAVKKVSYVADVLGGGALEKNGPTLKNLEDQLAELKENRSNWKHDIDSLRKRAGEFSDFLSTNPSAPMATSKEAEVALERAEKTLGKVTTENLAGAEAIMKEARSVWNDRSKDPATIISTLDDMASDLRSIKRTIDKKTKEPIASKLTKKKQAVAANEPPEKGSQHEDALQDHQSNRLNQHFAITPVSRERESSGKILLPTPIPLATYTGESPKQLKILIEPKSDFNEFEVKPEPSQSHVWMIKDAAHVVARLIFENGSIDLQWERQANDRLTSTAGSILERLIVIRSDSEVLAMLPVAAPTRGKPPQFSKDGAIFQVLLPLFGELQLEVNGPDVSGSVPTSGAQSGHAHEVECYLNPTTSAPSHIQPAPKLLGKLALSLKDGKEDRYGRKFSSVSTALFIEQEGLPRMDFSTWFDKQFEQINSGVGGVDNAGANEAGGNQGSSPNAKTKGRELRAWRDKLETQLPNLRVQLTIHANVVRDEKSQNRSILVYQSD